jgi:hypothetical protein
MHNCTIKLSEKHERRRAEAKIKCNCISSGHHVSVYYRQKDAVSFPFFLDAQTYLTYRVNRGFGSSQFYNCSYSTMNLTSSQLSD